MKTPSTNWHVLLSNGVIAAIGILGYLQPWLNQSSPVVASVVPAVAAGAIAALTAFFSHSPSATLQQITSTAATTDPEIKAALVKLSQSLEILNNNLAKGTPTQ